WLVAQLSFDHIPAIAKQAPVETETVRDPGFCRASITQRPSLGVEFVNPAPGVPARIGRIVPSAVVHYRPTHQLCAWIVRVPAVVEEIGYRESPGADAVAPRGPLAG